MGAPDKSLPRTPVPLRFMVVAEVQRWVAIIGCAIILVEENMKVFTAVIEKCSETELYVGYVPGFPGAHSQGESLDELNANLREVIEMLLEDGEPELEADFVGTQTVVVD